MTYKQTLRLIKTAGGFNPELVPQAFTAVNSEIVPQAVRDINQGLALQRAFRSSTNTPQGYNDSSWLFSLVPGLIAGGMSLFGGSGNKPPPTSGSAPQTTKPTNTQQTLPEVSQEQAKNYNFSQKAPTGKSALQAQKVKAKAAGEAQSGFWHNYTTVDPYFNEAQNKKLEQWKKPLHYVKPPAGNPTAKGLANDNYRKEMEKIKQQGKLPWYYKSWF